MRRIIKKKFNISVLFYVICAIMIVIIIPCAADIFDDTQDYYTFADAYKKAIDYNVYVNKGEYAKAEQIVKDIDNTQFNNVLFKEVLEKVKNTYIFEF